MIQNEHIEEFLRQAHRVGDAGLTVCSSGNLSWRVGDEVLVSGTGSWVPSLTKDKVAVCRLETGEILNGVKPSMESVFHLGVLRERPDVNVWGIERSVFSVIGENSRNALKIKWFSCA